MRGKHLSILRRQAVEHMDRRRGQGLSLSDYARAQGISVRQIHDAADTATGALASVNLYALVETAKANGIEPHACLTRLLTHCSWQAALRTSKRCFRSARTLP